MYVYTNIKNNAALLMLHSNLTVKCHLQAQKSKNLLTNVNKLACHNDDDYNYDYNYYRN